MTDKPDEKTDKEPRFGALDVVALAEDTYVLARSTDGVLVAYPRDRKTSRVAVEIRSLRPLLTRRLMADGNVVGRDTMGAALDALQAIAADAPEERVYLRAASIGAGLYLDLANADGDASFVEASAFGWEVVNMRDDEERVLPLFRRTSPTKSLPLPARVADGGRHPRDAFADLLGLDPKEPRFLLIWGWLVASLFERVPRPILWALGPQGSGKSTRARMVLSILEPCDALGRPPGDSERDDSTSARGRYLPSWDNIGTIGAKTSDWLCRLVTGVEIDRRALYTDDDVRTTVLRRSGVATSIVLPYGLGPDALERLVLLDFDRVDEADRKPESGLWGDFHRLHPTILGAVLDDVCGVLAARSGVASDPPKRLPRMADYALLLAALDAHTGLPAEEGYFAAYASSVSGVLAERAQEDPLTAGLLEIAASTPSGSWSGSAEALYKRLDVYRPEDRRTPWPNGPKSLGQALTRASETLRAAGIVAERAKTNGVRKIILSVAKDHAEEAA